ncbi:Radical SAM domain protein [Syntrophobotulus glycolicus DSM 8271]|uniref:Radical SAM domain protein n=1 Tax=Syntrophobotulus glycolicus (strain DSM 8271 / FlGlyR) TaxID=645991 RepID=F0SWZ0_SYNGF|nr:radical SAM protein [Syntrophobotulus glycolicus]ADY55773.1 Radical SAM domain protein [Syntrophobotulus glycolicus DSM 8271]
MKSTKQLISAAIMAEVFHYLAHDPMKNLPDLLDLADRFIVKKDFKAAAKLLREAAHDPENNINRLMQRFFHELNLTTQKKFLINFMVNAGIVGDSIIEKNKKKYQCNVPWAILFDPTAACNLKCTGCWAAEYGRGLSLDYSVMEKIVRQGKPLGIYMYILSGGEPTVRKKDILRLAEENEDCMFLSFTNGTLIDEEFASEVERIGNFAFALSVEGNEEETDMRRGKGTYLKVMEAMDILQKHGILFGFSTCYHSKNTATVGSEEYIDLMIEKGCKFGWYFTYIPIGKDAVPELLATPEQREYMYHQTRKFRAAKPCFVLDFWNDGEHVDGCIAGGRKYLHINANGDVEPCAFIHYSNVNIKDVDLIDALRSPLFMEYRRHQPFNDNHLRPCPMLDNPEILREMVDRSGAHSTQFEDSETVTELTAKTAAAAEKWAPVADRLWSEPRE